VVPSPELSLTLREFFDLLSEHCGLTFSVLPARQWATLLDNHPRAPMYPLRSMFTHDMHNGQSILELYQHTYRWDTANVRRHLEATSIREPEFTPGILARYLRHLRVVPG
jgi:thioester reductase-like protein